MIYICYGITKSASTFLYQMTEEVFSSSGRKIARLREPFRKNDSIDNYFNLIDSELLSRIADAIGDQDIVLKTHGPATEDIAKLVASGRLLASASIRDPREIALSMLDHGQRSRKWKYQRFSEFAVLDDTLNAIDGQLRYFQSWADIAAVRVFKYNDICFNSAAVLKLIAEQIGSGVNSDGVLDVFRHKTRIGQFSKGKALRYRELNDADQELFLERYRDLYQSYEFDTEEARQVARSQEGKIFKPSGEFAQHLINFRRRFRI